MVRFRILALCAFLLMPVVIVHGERKFDIGNQYDFVFGETNQSGIASQLQGSLAPFYGFYPSVSVKSTGRQSVFDVTYTALLERFNGEQKLNSFSHVVNSNFALNVNRRFRLNFNGTFSSIPDYTLVQVLQNTPVAADRNFVYQPSLGKGSMQAYRGSAGAELDVTYRSYFTFDYSAMALNHNENGGTAVAFVDQRRRQGRIAYWYRLSSRQSLDLQYVNTTNVYSDFGRGMTHAGLIGFRRQISPTLEIHVQAGPAYVTYDNVPAYYGYAVDAFVTRKIKSSNIAGFYSHTPGDSSGFGTLSDLQSGGLSVFTPIWKRMELATSLSAFSSSGATDIVNRHRGFYGTVNLSYPLSQRWFLTWGGSYRLNVHDTLGNQEYKRLFISLRFRAPEFWRTSL